MSHEQIAARQTLIATTRRAGEAMPPFSAWLLGGFAAAFSLIVSNIETVSKFILITHIRFGLLIFLASLAIAVVATYLSVIVKAGLAAQEDGEAIGKAIATSKDKFDFEVYLAEYQRGLFPPIRWLSRSPLEKAKAGDFVAGARFLAKLSQLQAILVVVQSLLVLVAISVLALGLKLD